MKKPEELLTENEDLLKSAQLRAANKGYRSDLILKTALDYIRTSKGLGMNTAEFYSTLTKAKELVGQSVLICAIPEITADDAKV